MGSVVHLVFKTGPGRLLGTREDEVTGWPLEVPASFNHNCVTETDQWQCRCGNFLFRIDPNGPYCASCGTTAKGWF